MIRLIDINKKYGDKIVYENFNLDVEDNKVLAVLGESGSGKTTLINILAHLTDAEGRIEGEITPISMVFQKDRLVPNLTARENVTLVNPDADVDNLFSLLKLDGQQDNFIKNLSAGMARRVAIARALAYPAPILLLDEPFINLDVAIKFSIIKMLKEQQKKSPKTVIFVTHDIKEAANFADRIIVLKNGKIACDIKDVSMIEQTEKKLFAVMMGEEN